MKKMVVSFLVAVMALGASGVVSAAADTKPITVKVDGNLVNFPDAQPFIDAKSNRTLVPVRFVSEALGAKVEWKEDIQTVEINKNGRPISLKIGEKVAIVSGRKVAFDQSAIIKNSRTYVPLRFVSEALQSKVDWKVNERTVLITTLEKVVAFGKNTPVNESNSIFQEFHRSLEIKDGVITGKVPKAPSKDYEVSVSFHYNEGLVKAPEVVTDGNSFSRKLSEIDVMGIFIYDRRGKGKTLAFYSYRSLPNLSPVKVGD
ncbi:copper amine oxidase N-terminal domain-containing protein [Brevibacillus sp. SYP-B805]|uniref:copper amine oxidase N-terminal domain-containing protein n=1 Tax=Brevibacillus sp. SYP-B805 TaxID=1578199 RepID=UPI0013EC3FCA|nr:copper amine oxidase N-terminal domain-containing protein [Brevibacillus sp. SYP-B805]NGQ96207.1 copper amine oxidase N-terminal domain-containing protein [Brevibacillus sp. SYP-B805]